MKKVKIKIKLFDLLAHLAGKREIIYDIHQNATIGDVIYLLFKFHPKIRDVLVDNSGELNSFLIVYNGKAEINSSDAFQLLVENDSEIMLILPGVGG